MALTPLPALDRTSATFKTDLDTYFLTALPAFSSEANALQADVTAKQVLATAASAEATNQAELAANQVTLAANQVTLATLQASAAASSAITAGASLWVSGTAYAVGNARYSPINGQTYRRLTAGAGTTDPSADTTNWQIINGLVSQNVQIPVNNLPAIRPSLDLDFANSQTVDPRITFARASTATRTNSKGLIESVASGVPRIDFDAVTGACKGLLVEEQRARLNTISLLPTAVENVTVTAVAHTVSFYGTGTVALSGTGSATIVGTGAYPARTILTITPTAGTLTLTPTGSVNDLQVEAGGFATSVIRGEGTQVTRAADVASMTGANFSSWYRQDEGSFVVESSAIGLYAAGAQYIVSAGTSAANEIRIRYVNANVAPQIHDASGQTFSTLMTAAANTVYKVSLGYKSNDTAASINATTTVTDTSVALPFLANSLSLGSQQTGNGFHLNGHIRSLSYYPKRCSNAELQALSTQ